MYNEIQFLWSGISELEKKLYIEMLTLLIFFFLLEFL